MKERIWILLAAALACAEPALAESPRAVTLKNGLMVLVVPDSTARAADVAVWYRAGTRFEPASASGLTSLFGRLMFGGSASFPAGEHRRLLELEGGTGSSVINPDYTCFFSTVPPGGVDLALRLEADRMASLRITESDFATTRGLAAEEQQVRLERSALSLGIQRLYAAAFEGHPYARPVIGRAGELEKLTLADAQSYWRERFAPQQAMLTVVGPIDADAILALARKHFEAIPRRPAKAAGEARLSPQTAERNAYARTTDETTLLLIGWRGPGSPDPDSPALDALAQILTGGVASRLKQVLARRAYFTQIEGDYDRSRDGSLLFCMAALSSGADTAKAKDAMTEAIEALAAQPVSEEELEAAKRRLESGSLLAWQTARGRADAIGSAQILDGDHRAAASRLDRVRRLDAADIQRAAARCLRPENRSVVWVLPSNPAGGSSRGGGR